MEPSGFIRWALKCENVKVWRESVKGNCERERVNMKVWKGKCERESVKGKVWERKCESEGVKGKLHSVEPSGFGQSVTWRLKIYPHGQIANKIDNKGGQVDFGRGQVHQIGNTHFFPGL